MRVLLPLLLAFVSTGCLRSTTTIDLRPDGSGTIVQETGVSPQTLAMLKNFGGANQTSGALPADLFTEEQARKAADTMGVTFVSGEPIKTADLEGYRSRYSFDDISKVRVSMEQGSGMGATVQAGGGAGAKDPPFKFGFDKSAASSLLTIDVPAQLPGNNPLAGLPGAGGTSDADKAQAAQVLGMMKMMMQGLFVDVSLNVNGRILKSNAPYVEGSRVTLMQIDFDKLVADPSSLQKLQSATALKDLSNIPGLKIFTDPKVSIEFTR